MQYKNSILSVENILYISTLFLLLYYYISDPQDQSFVIIFAVLTIIPVLLAEIPKIKNYTKIKSFGIAVQNLKYSSFLFVFGIIYSRVSTANIPPEITMTKAVVTVIIFGFLLVGSFLFVLVVKMYEEEQKKIISEEIISRFQKSVDRNNIIGFEELLETVNSDYGNVMLVAGNLLSLKTEFGARLLTEFLAKHSDNVLQLIIPKSSYQYLKDLKANIDCSYLSRIKVIKYDPYWFLQGIVIVGKKIDATIKPLACYFYKVKLSDEEEIASDGIYIDLSTYDTLEEYPQSVTAYYHLINELHYANAVTTVEKVFGYVKSNKVFNPGRKVNWNSI